MWVKHKSKRGEKENALQKQGYVAILLSKQSAAVLQGLAVHARVYSHHLTLAFKPSEELWRAHYRDLIGQPIELPVIGIASDEKGQAALVQLPEGVHCTNEHPHVTVSCAEGTKPFYSNKLLNNQRCTAHTATLQGTVTFVSFN